MSILPIETRFFGVQRNNECKVRRMLVQAPIEVDELTIAIGEGSIGAGSIIHRITMCTTSGENGLPTANPTGSTYQVLAIGEDQETTYEIYTELSNDSENGNTTGGEYLHKPIPEDCFLGFFIDAGDNTDAFWVIIDYVAMEAPAQN
jgi:hypothetical protein